MVYVVADEEPVPDHIAHHERLSWNRFSSIALGLAQTDLAVLVGGADRDRTLERLRGAAASCTLCRVLVVLRRDASPEEIDLAFALGDDVLLCPEREEVVQQRINRLLSAATPETLGGAYEDLIVEMGRANLIGQAPAFLKAAEKLSASARLDFPVLITGETGTGKEVFARALHFMSRRRNQPFVPVDCGGIPDHLFENEIFGHVRGAYTDAHGEQRGLAGIAEGGTLFLDEVDSLSTGAQAKLLRYLQEKQFKPLGADRYTPSDVKLVAATNGCLEEQVEDRRFRKDLYFRLNVLRLDLPPLRERPGDIALLANHFLALYALPDSRRRRFSPAALRQMQSYSWPGNVRELANVVQRAIAFSQTTSIDVCDILPRRPSQVQTFREARENSLDSFEREYVEELLRRHNGNVTHAAREAGKERRAFGRLVKKHKLGAQWRAAGRG